MEDALHVVQWNILREIQYFVRGELLRQLLLLQVCQRTRFSGLEWDAMTFWNASECTTVLDEDSILTSHRKGV